MPITERPQHRPHEPQHLTAAAAILNPAYEAARRAYDDLAPLAMPELAETMQYARNELEDCIGIIMRDITRAIEAKQDQARRAVQEAIKDAGSHAPSGVGSRRN